MKIAFNFVLSALVLLVGLSAARSQEDQETKAPLGFSARVIQAEAAKKRAALFEKYAEAVTHIQIEFQEKGDLASALKARNEAAKARESAVMGNEQFSGIGKLRKILKSEVEKIDRSEIEEIVKAQTIAVEKLEAQVTVLTKSGKLDEAAEMDSARKSAAALMIQYRDRLAKLDANPADVKNTSNEASPAPEMRVSAKPAPFKKGEIVYGEFLLAPGSHRLRDEVQIGNRIKNLDSEKGFLVIGENTEAIGGGLYTHFGSIGVDGARLEKVRIEEAIQGTFSAVNAIFDDCVFNKKGAWAVAYWGSKWKFKNCVVAGSFFEQLSAGTYGIKVNDCTFIDVEFPTDLWKKDGGTESQSDWRIIENCRFIECKVPISILISTKNCVFEDCRFIEDEVEDTNPISAPVEVRLAYTGISEPKLPAHSPLMKFQLVPADDTMSEVGCESFYEEKGGKLQFR